jgi:YiaA/B family protein
MTYHEIPTQQHSGAWVAFSYLSFGVSLAMIVGGLYFLQMDPWVKAYFAMGAESRPRKFGQYDKWIFCLTAVRILSANQERR